MSAADREQLGEWGTVGCYGSPRGYVQCCRGRLRRCIPGQVAKRCLEEFSRSGFYRLYTD